MQDTATIDETTLRERIAALGRDFRAAGLAPGTSGNISAVCADGWLMTPTGIALGALDPADIAKLDWNGNHIAGAPPTKESVLHRAVYDRRPDARAVIHLHSTHAVAVSCLDGLDPASCLAPLTPYFVMRVGRLPRVPYHRPGDPALAEAVRAHAARHKAMLLANHGPVVAGRDLDDARNIIEELEETARLTLLLAPHATRPLDADQTAELRDHFDADW